MGQFDIALQPAVTDYASPLKMFEYLAAGCLVVAPAKDNILEILDRDTALLFAEDDFADFETQLKFGIENIQTLMPMRERARALIDLKQFTWQDNARRVVAIARQAADR